MTVIFNESSFDVTASIAFMYLWMFFGFFTILNNCELQKLATSNVYVQHLMVFLAFFFLITIIDTQNNEDVLRTWIKTVIVYLIFVVTTKMKLWGLVLLIILLIIDLTIRAHIQYRIKQGDKKEDISIYEKQRRILRYMMFGIIIIAFVHYLVYQEKEYGKEFSMTKFLLGTGKCHYLMK